MNNAYNKPQTCVRNHKEFITHYDAKPQVHDLNKFGVLVLLNNLQSSCSEHLGECTERPGQVSNAISNLQSSVHELSI